MLTAALAGLVVGGFGSAAKAQLGGEPLGAVCSKSWANAVSGSWSDGSKWTPSGVPSSSDDVCITANGTYTVTSGGPTAAATLTLGGTSGTQTLRLQAECIIAGDAQLTVGGSAQIGANGTIRLTSASGCGSFSAGLDAGGNTITNSGSIVSLAGGGGGRFLNGNLTNSGTVTVNQPLTLTGDVTNTNTVGANQSLTWQGSGTWLNRGALSIGDGAVVSASSGGQTFTNTTGGSITETGSGQLTMSRGTFNHGAGTISGANPIELTFSNLNITSANAASFLWQGTANLSGNLSATQTLTLQAECAIAGDAVVTAAGSFTNAGTIRLTSASGCGSFSAGLDAGGNTITNSGSIVSLAGGGGGRFLNGNIRNQKTLDLGAGTTLQLNGDYTQTSTGVFGAHVDSGSSFGKLTATGAASLAGKVRVSRLATFVPNAGDTFAILGAASRSGKWSKEIGGVIRAGKYFLPRYSATGASLVVKVASLAISPSGGPPGTAVTLTGSSYPPNDTVTLSFKDSAGTVTNFVSITTTPAGGFSAIRNVPAGAAVGNGTFTAKSTLTAVKVNRTFTV